MSRNLRNKKKDIERYVRVYPHKKYYKDVSLPIWEGQNIKRVIKDIYYGTNFQLKNYKTKKITPAKTIVYETIESRKPNYLSKLKK
jgi:hypothetical protein